MVRERVAALDTLRLRIDPARRGQRHPCTRLYAYLVEFKPPVKRGRSQW
jgi:hypothetical protein